MQLNRILKRLHAEHVYLLIGSKIFLVPVCLKVKDFLFYVLGEGWRRPLHLILHDTNNSEEPVLCNTLGSQPIQNREVKGMQFFTRVAFEALSICYFNCHPGCACSCFTHCLCSLHKSSQHHTASQRSFAIREFKVGNWRLIKWADTYT